MVHKRIWRAALMMVLCAVLASPADAITLNTAGNLVVAGIIIVGASIGVVVAVLVVHEKHKNTRITGCIAGTTGLILSNEKDSNVYTLSGDTRGIKQGERMTLEGRRHKGDSGPTFDVHRMASDLGPCRP